MRELATVAAMVLVGVSLLFPMLSNARGVARQVVCQSHLAAAGAGFGAYAMDYNGALPATDWREGDPWWNINQFDGRYAQSNSAHLFQLPRLGYVSFAGLGCPENAHSLAQKQQIDMSEHRDWPDHESICYSYQNQFTHDRPRWGGSRVIAVLADKSPLFASDDNGRVQFVPERADARSEHHDGQNMLLNTGEVRWTREPVLAGNRIYHVGDGAVDAYTGRETPAHAGDTFLVP